jgi:hypothetical protein
MSMRLSLPCKRCPRSALAPSSSICPIKMNQALGEHKEVFIIRSEHISPVPADRWGLYLRCAPGGAGLPCGHRGVSQPTHQPRGYRADGDLSSLHLAPVRGQHPPGRSGLALWDPAQVGRSPLGGRARVDVRLRSGVRADDRRRGHPSDGARWRGAASDKRGVDSL